MSYLITVLLVLLSALNQLIIFSRISCSINMHVLSKRRPGSSNVYLDIRDRVALAGVSLLNHSHFFFYYSYIKDYMNFVYYIHIVS